MQIDKILSRSLAIIKGGKELFKLELITPPLIVTPVDVFFLNGNKEVQIFYKGTGCS